MFEYTCPTCKTTIRADDIEDGKVVACTGPKCGQRLRVVLDDTAQPGPAKGGGCARILPIGCCGLLGLFLAAGIVGAWYFLGRDPSKGGLFEQLSQAKTETPPTTAPATTGKSETPPPDTGHSTQVAEKPGGKEETTQPLTTPVAAPAPPEKPAELAGEQIYKKLLKSTVWIVASDGRNTWSGSGAVVDREERLVITNEHVANESCRWIMVFLPAYKPDGKPIVDRAYYSALLEKKQGIPAHLARTTDRRRDLALIQLDTLKDAVPVPLAANSPSPGKVIHTIGAKPLGSNGMWIHGEGSVRQVSFAQWKYSDNFPRAGLLIDSQLPINPGDSGGPVVDTRCLLVGVNAMAGSGQLTLGHIDVTEVRDYLRTHLRSLGRDLPEAPDVLPDAAASAQIDRAIEDLSQENAVLRREAAIRLAQYGPAARRAVPPLLRLLQNRVEAQQVREAAEGALGEIGAPAPDQVPYLMLALDEESTPEARIYAADALSKLGADAAPALRELVKALKASEPEVRRAIASALGKLGTLNRAVAFPGLMSVLNDPVVNVRVAAGLALVKLGKPEANELPEIQRLLADVGTQREGRIYAIWALGSSGQANVADLLKTVRTDPDPGIVAIAVEQLGLLNVKTDEVGKVLADCIARPESEVRYEAAIALARLGVQDSTLPGVLKTLNSEDGGCRKAILDTLPPIGTFVQRPPKFGISARSLEPLKASLTSEQMAARAFAAYVLGTLGPKAEPAIPDLRKALEKERKVKLVEGQFWNIAEVEMIQAAGELGPQARDLAPTLREIFKDTAIDRKAACCAALVFVKVAENPDEKIDAYKTITKAFLVNDVEHQTPLEKELVVRAKRTLPEGHRLAAKAMYETLISLFEGPGAEKVYARRCCYELWEQMGKNSVSIDDPAFTTRFKNFLNRKMLAQDEDPENRDHARAARVNIFGTGR